MKMDILEGRLDSDSLFIVDSSLEDEPNREYYDFKRSIPAMLDMLDIHYKHIIPASGGVEGRVNNNFFFTFLENRDKIEDWGQRCLESYGLTGSPKNVVDAILEYHEVLYPGEIKREVGLLPAEGSEITSK